MKARVNKFGNVVLTPESEAEHFILHHNEFETVEEEYGGSVVNVRCEFDDYDFFEQLREALESNGVLLK